MDAIVRVAIIKEDFTWEEKFVETGGANWINVFDNAEIRVRMELRTGRPHYLKGILGVKALFGKRTDVEE